MHFDFTLILTALVIMTFVLWMANKLIFKRLQKQRHVQGEGSSRLLTVLEYIGSFFPVLVFVWVLRCFLYEPFRIPSGSMIPTLLVGDYIVVNKFAYGVRLPVLNSKIIDIGSPQRGDVVVFRYPPDEKLNYIKRLVGLPGDRITYRNKQVLVNGERVLQEPSGFYLGDTGQCYGGARVALVTETLGGVEHPVLMSNARLNMPEESWVLGDDEYFMMGDNRDCSQDSRSWGTVPEANLVGRASRIWWHWNLSQGGPDFSRIGDRIE